MSEELSNITKFVGDWHLARIYKGINIEFRTEPQQMYQRKVAFRDMAYGWAVCVWVNDRNSAGALAGFYPMTFFFRNEKIVKWQPFESHHAALDAAEISA